ncbi:hypothetical protein A5886_002725 [Enterococcus sp. 8G7_MSG3316]|uniref:HTH deoR-type domain-containing protein n=1 Tax=Candidatus Enterococcus testudinis TaxID=1834191 RepID=A0A242A9B3_9ENTE|nr:DeoR/GlpR family DNA-binding transcription regulator [Enterococcus sp. 8G7_MSG3316]OTN77625.1 hypothetical protein A5886_002725 [Enterococcus sp. 8G7_MSG3316]
MKASQGSVYRRREAMIQFIEEREQATVNELAVFFHVSLVTIRRDLLFLEKKRLIERYYGGVRIKKANSLYSQQALSSAISTADLIRSCQSFVRNKQRIFIGASRHSTALIGALMERDLTIITNDYQALSVTQNGQSGIVYLCGGELEAQTNALVGDLATWTFARFEADLCIVEVHGINAHEITSRTLAESFVYRTMLHHTTGETIIYTDGENMGQAPGFMIDRTFSADHLLVSGEVPLPMQQQFAQAGVKIHLLTDPTRLQD